jgi:hypothetical protein
MAAFASVDKHLAGVGHGRSVAVSKQFSIETSVKKYKQSGPIYRPAGKRILETRRLSSCPEE